MQMCLFASIAKSAPELFTTIRENVEMSLVQITEDTILNRDLIRKLSAAGSIKSDSKPHLYLVPNNSDLPLDDDSLN